LLFYRLVFTGQATDKTSGYKWKFSLKLENSGNEYRYFSMCLLKCPSISSRSHLRKACKNRTFERDY